MTSKAGYWIGGGLVAVAVLGAIAWALVGVFGVKGAVDDFQRVAVPGRANVHLEARKYVIYVEGRYAELAPAVDIVVERPRTGKPLPLAPYGSELTYTFDTQGTAVRTFTPPRAGSYRVRTDDGGLTSGGYAVAFGDSIADRLVFAAVGALAFGAALGLAGLALLIVTYVRRSRRSKAPRTNFGAPSAS